MWAYACGVVSSGEAAGGRWIEILAGIALAGPLVCGTSQAVNDWYDRHVDAINEPGRPIPSGRIPGQMGLFIGIAWTGLSLAVAVALGTLAFAGAVVGLTLAWLYSAPPVRLKRDGWAGAVAVGACYEGLPWFIGAAVMAGGMPDARILLVAALYSAGAIGIMALNDFKSVVGDRQSGINSLPVRYGIESAARLACALMALPQVVVIACLLAWGAPLHAGIVSVLLAVQLVLMRRLLGDPRGLAPWYNATGTMLYVLGMLTAAFAIRDSLGGM
jgi:chlorophyll synthase